MEDMTFGKMRAFQVSDIYGFRSLSFLHFQSCRVSTTAMALGIHGPSSPVLSDLTCCLHVFDISGASVRRLGLFIMACTFIDWMEARVDR